MKTKSTPWKSTVASARRTWESRDAAGRTARDELHRMDQKLARSRDARREVLMTQLSEVSGIDLQPLREEHRKGNVMRRRHLAKTLAAAAESFSGSDTRRRRMDAAVERVKRHLFRAQPEPAAVAMAAFNPATVCMTQPRATVDEEVFLNAASGSTDHSVSFTRVELGGRVRALVTSDDGAYHHHRVGWLFGDEISYTGMASIGSELHVTGSVSVAGGSSCWPLSFFVGAAVAQLFIEVQIHRPDGSVDALPTQYTTLRSLQVGEGQSDVGLMDGTYSLSHPRVPVEQGDRIVVGVGVELFTATEGQGSEATVDFARDGRSARVSCTWMVIEDSP